MSQLYDSPEQHELHLKAMKSLANETGHEFPLVRQVYERELALLQSGANLTEFILLFACRRTREILRKSRKSERPQAVSA